MIIYTPPPQCATLAQEMLDKIRRIMNHGYNQPTEKRDTNYYKSPSSDLTQVLQRLTHLIFYTSILPKYPDKH